MRPIYASALAVVLVGIPATAEDKQDKGTEELQGTWRMVTLAREGKSLPEDQVKQHTFVIKGNNYTLKMGDKAVEEGTFTADAGKTPRAVEFTITTGDDKGKKYHGIYEVKGDTLKAIVAPSAKERPTDFKPNDLTRFIEGKREKP